MTVTEREDFKATKKKGLNGLITVCLSWKLNASEQKQKYKHKEFREREPVERKVWQLSNTTHLTEGMCD